MPPPNLEARDYIGLGPTAPAPAPSSSSGETGPHLALRLGLPGRDPEEAAVDAALTLGPSPAPAPQRGGAKRGFADSLLNRSVAAAGAGGEEDKKKAAAAAGAGSGAPPAAKAQVVGWPPVRSYRKNTLAANATKTKADNQGRSEAGCCYVKVSMDGAPYLRKVDLKTYSSYDNLSVELEKMFSCFITGKSSSCKTDALQDQEYVLTYEDRDADWMLVGDLPWDLFTTTCRKLRIMRGSDAAGMAPR